MKTVTKVFAIVLITLSLIIITLGCGGGFQHSSENSDNFIVPFFADTLE